MGARRMWLPTSVVAIGLVAIFVVAAAAQTTRERWVATWAVTLEGTPPANAAAVTPAAAPNPLLTVKNQTIRIPIKIGVGGPRLRLKLSNEYGAKPVVIGAASVVAANADWTTRPFKSIPDGVQITKANSDWTVKAGTFAKVTFNGASQVTIPRGARVLSDPIDMRVTPLQELAVSLYLPDETFLSTFHNENAGGSSPRPVLAPGAVLSKEGDFTAVAALPVAAPTGDQHVHPPFLSAVEVVAPASTPVVVILGDTWSEGPGFWSSELRDRAAPQGIAVVNMAQVAGALVYERPGGSGLARFDRDVLGVSGVSHALMFIGSNDIILPRPERGDVLPVSTITWAMKQAADRARAAGLKVIGTTILPFEGISQTVRPGLDSPEKGRMRAEINTWLRANRGMYDGFVDFDELLRDPQHPARLLPAYDWGNHFAINPVGSRKLADAFDLKLFRK